MAETRVMGLCEVGCGKTHLVGLSKLNSVKTHAVGISELDCGETQAVGAREVEFYQDPWSGPLRWSTTTRPRGFH